MYEGKKVDNPLFYLHTWTDLKNVTISYVDAI